MITFDNFSALLIALNFTKTGKHYSKTLAQGTILAVDFDKKELIYPPQLIVHEKQTCHFLANENFVVFECVHRLLEKGYKAEHIELEPRWQLGHGAKGGRADIQIKDNDGKSLLIIECKTAGKEFEKAWDKTQKDGGQLLSYLQQDKDTQFVCLYTADCNQEKLDYKNYIIPTSDIKNLVEQYSDNDKNKPLFYKDAGKVTQLYQVWVETYGKISYESGIFETQIQAYRIGQEKITARNLKIIPNAEIQKKYNEFAEILRTHNVSSKESAFDKLVNLFLCKIVDETQSIRHEIEHKNSELAFYWRGEQFDDYFSLIDRLQVLYKEGMKEYLGEEITYINNEMIDNAFWAVKHDRNQTKKKIKEYFTELKFFTNNDFGFIDVHNRKLFYQNAAILLDVVKMWQNIRLNGDQQHQFLGDMFEFFLDKGFKQSEGQFFTPIPICRFILQSLPLEYLIKNSAKPPQLIDYACGAGHFLTEYAAQLKSILSDDSEKSVSDYYQAIFGVEKEYRLSKVAKISTFMYGQGDINVIYCDALKEIRQQIKNKEVLVELESCNILVANPPFAVDFFLKNLSDKERGIYDLLDTVADEQNNRNVQCFFIERAKQLLAPKGIAGIIVPSSVLSNSDATHIGAREILLKYFDIVAIVELGSGTFGKTGTNTVVLFLRRKAKQPTEADQYWSRVEDWFSHDEEMDIYQDGYILKAYCQHIGIGFEIYKSLLSGKPSAELLAIELFVDYKNAFDKSKQKKDFIVYLQAIEKEKLFYFAMAYHNPQKVLVVKSPSDNKEQKKFLGYEWSAAKGNEGIKYNGGNTVNEIVTPLFDAMNRNNPDKLNYWIAQNFLGNELDLSDLKDLEGLVSTNALCDMLDFSRTDFDKEISITPKNSIVIETKWDLVKLGGLCEVIAGQSPESQYYNEQQNGLPFYQGKKDFGKTYLNNPVVWTAKTTKEAIKNDILMSVRAPVGDVNINPFEKICIGRGLAAIRFNNLILQKYLFEFINQNQFLFKGNKGTTFDAISTDDLRQIKVPLPDKNIQEKIVAECEAVDSDVEKAEQEVNQTKIEIENKIIQISKHGYVDKKISEIAYINPSKSELKGIDELTIISFVEMASVSSNGFIQHKEDKPLKDLKKGSYTYFKESDIIIAKITPCMENGKCALANGLTNDLAMGSSEFHVIRCKKIVLSKYVFTFLNRNSVRKEAERNMTGSSGHRRVPAHFYEDYKIPVPDLSIQKTLVAEIELLETKIAAAQQIIHSAAAKKQAILKSYL